ncbi:MAG: phenylalanine--tRNA ligase subunit beta [Clostridiales bacterium]|nr:phenylalanine--tRNA ligase subunit beta [Clostridiales bacterium]
MKVPISWLADYVKIEGNIKDYSDMMTMSGSKVEGYEKPFHEITNVVTGKITEITSHPDADKLVITKVDVKTDLLQVVTGAKNISIGDIIPIALHNSTLPNGVVITKGKLRGVESNGMMCSIAELNLTKNDFPLASEDGIFILPKDTKLGVDIKEILGLDDTVVEFEITSNRPDCLSIIGLARESAVTIGKKFELPNISLLEKGKGTAKDYINVTIEDYELCKRYTGKVITDVIIKQSPLWMRKRLRDAGVRPINNIVDITNYVMLEYGQPMHAFDLNYLKEKNIVIRRAKENEIIHTLDDQKRILNTQNLVIADGDKAIAVAGVMGGANSEVNNDTTKILFESANFDGVSVRLTAKQLGLRTESSARFEKGLDPYNANKALLRACELVEKLDAGKVVPGIIDCYKELPAKKIVPFRPKKMNEFLGTSIKEQTMIDILTSLDFEVDKGKMEIAIPTFRSDVEAWADISEEVVRFYGYNNIKASLQSGNRATQGIKTYEQRIRDTIRESMLAMGLMEIYTYSFTSRKVFDKLLLKDDSKLRETVVITNPLGEDFSIMRTTTIPEMLQVISHNYNRRIAKASFFETSNTYHPIKNEKLPLEKNILTMGLYGDYNFYSIKGIIEKLADTLGITDVRFVADSNNPSYHPGRCAQIKVNEDVIGTIGEIHPDVADNFEVPKRSYIGELDIEKLYKLTSVLKSYKGLPKYPEVDRDLAMVVDESVLAYDIEQVIKSNGGDLLQNVTLFDVYRGEQVGENKKSMAYALSFRANDRTLTDEEVNKAVKEILSKLDSEIGAILR